MNQESPASQEESSGMPGPERTISARGASGVGGASAIAAASGLLITFVVARTLDPAETAQFLIFWSLLFGLFGILSGIQSETTRAVRSTAMGGERGRGGAARVLPAGMLVGSGVSVLLLVTSIFWAGAVLPAGQPWVLLAIGVAGVAYSGHVTLAGASAGSQDWRLYSWLMALESVIRLAAVVVVAFLTASLVGLELACTLGALVWTAFILTSRSARTAIGARADVSLGELVRQHSYALVSAAATAALVVGFPLMFSLTSTPTTVAASAGLLLAVQLTRAPIMIPLQAFQGVAIASFVAQRERGLRALVRPVGIIMMIAIGGALLAWLIGPWLMLIFGKAYVVDGLVLGLLTLGAGVMATLTLTGAASLAGGYHRVYTLGWVTATVASIGLLMLPVAADERVVLSLSIGPVAGILVHCVGISSHRGRWTDEGETQV